jgi:uncharacterized membrane protein YhaH (DUF805 family)
MSDWHASDKKPEPRSALLSGLHKGLTFRGRATRAEFFGFAPVWTIFCGVVLAVLTQTFPAAETSLFVLAFVAIVSVPLWAAAIRRVRDAGRPAHEGMYPFAPISVAVGALYMISAGDPPTNHGSKSPAGIILLGSLALLVPYVLFGLFSGLQRFGEQLGVFLLPSDVDTSTKASVREAGSK